MTIHSTPERQPTEATDFHSARLQSALLWNLWMIPGPGGGFGGGTLEMPDREPQRGKFITARLALEAIEGTGGGS